jgi:hypothetical protein
MEAYFTHSHLKFSHGNASCVKLLCKTDYKPTEAEALLQVELEEKIISQTLFELIELTDRYANSHFSLSINTIVK